MTCTFSFFGFIERPLREAKLPSVISKRIIANLKFTDNIKVKSIIAMLYSSGVQRGELINSRIQDIDFDKKIIFVRALMLRHCATHMLE